MKKTKLKKRIAKLEEEVLRLNRKIQELTMMGKTQSIIHYKNGEEVTKEKYQFYDHTSGKPHYNGPYGRDPDLEPIVEIVREGPC